MIYSYLADLVVLLHATYVGFVVLGMVAVLLGVFCGWSWVRNFWFRALHLSMIGIVVCESLLEITCPFTSWENQLRLLAGEDVPPGSFLGRWVHDLLFIDAPAWAFTVCYCLFGAAVLATFLCAPPRWPGRQSGSR